MIDEKTDTIYNIILSIFVGVVVVILIKFLLSNQHSDIMFKKPIYRQPYIPPHYLHHRNFYPRRFI